VKEKVACQLPLGLPPESAERSVLTVDEMNDIQVDSLFPEAAQRASSRYWTPVAVARRSAQILDDLGVRRVLDVGSGPGKFCVVAGARAPQITFVGVEHRAHLVAMASALAAQVRVGNAVFRLDDATRLPWTGFEGVYVFNSFAENRFAGQDQFDQTVELSRMRYIADVMRVERQLAAAPVGTILLTYYGLGGPIPNVYERVHVEAAGTSWLQVWRRIDAAANGTYWVEDDADAFRMTAAELDRRLFLGVLDELFVADLSEATDEVQGSGHSPASGQNGRHG
jgi:SAM-dependent methyltransferase